MTPQQLFTLAGEFAEASAKAERARAHAATTTGYMHDHAIAEAATWDGLAATRREKLRTALFTGAYGPGPDGARYGTDPAYAEVLASLHLRVYPPEAGDVTDYVVLDLHGVSIGVKRRDADLYVHVDTSETADRVIAFEVNDGGEVDHPTR
jgi:hypothetical protein